MQNETLYVANEKLVEGMTLYVHFPFQLLEYLCEGYTLKKAKRFSKIQAFKDLVLRYRNNSIYKTEKAAVNISQLARDWGWSRLTVSQFANELKKMGIIETNSVGSNIFVSIKSDVLKWVSPSQKLSEAIQEAPDPSLVTVSQSSSSEKKEDFYDDKKSSENE